MMNVNDSQDTAEDKQEAIDVSTGTAKHESSNVRNCVWQLVSQYVEEADDADFRAAAVMIAALFVGANEQEIIDLTAYAPEYVHEIGQRMRASGLWENDVVHYEPWDHHTQAGYIRFILDLCVALGMLMRTGKKGGKEYVYEAVVSDDLQS